MIFARRKKRMTKIKAVKAREKQGGIPRSRSLL